MRCTILSLLVPLGLASIGFALPATDDSIFVNVHSLSKRALSTDNTCGLTGAGNNKGYTCNPALPQGGTCCSSGGWCGNSTGYCGAGCQSQYGTCTQDTNTNTYQCGPKYGNLKCGYGLCCSANGYCGGSDEYCGTGCQTGFGSCSSPTTPPNTNTYECGPQFGYQVCGGGLCCSSSGYCGNSTAYCGTGCQGTFGVCQTETVPDGFQCGVQNNNQTCGTSKCCSINGYCGTTDPYCGDGCQGKFGKCNPGAEQSDGTCGPLFGNKKCSNGDCCSASGLCGKGEYFCADPACQYQFGSCDSDVTPAGTSTINDPRPVLGSVTYTDDIYDCVKPKVVALTYDDGPYIYTDQLLDVLKKYKFKATFFMTGNNLAKGSIDTNATYRAVIQRMVNEGHQVASHTWSHYNLSGLPHDLRIQQMVKNERAIANIIGKYPTYMRPPYSDCTQQSGCWNDMKALGYHRTYFDLDTQDYINASPDLVQLSKNIVYDYIDGAQSKGANDWLSIQHDIHQQSVANLSDYYFGLIQKKGWTGVTVGECLNDPEQNWYRQPGTGKGVPVTSVKPSSTTTKPSSTSTTKKPTSTAHSTTTTKKTSTTTKKSTVAATPKASAKRH